MKYIKILVFIIIGLIFVGLSACTTADKLSGNFQQGVGHMNHSNAKGNSTETLLETFEGTPLPEDELEGQIPLHQNQGKYGQNGNQGNGKVFQTTESTDSGMDILTEMSTELPNDEISPDEHNPELHSEQKNTGGGQSASSFGSGKGNGGIGQGIGCGNGKGGVQGNGIGRGNGQEKGNSQGQGDGVSGGVGQGYLTEMELDNLLRAFEGEFYAQALYQKIIDTFGAVEPFQNIINSEVQHIDSLIRLAEKYGVSVPDYPAPKNLPEFETIQDACKAGAIAEAADAQFYDELLSQTTHQDIILIFTNLKNASIKNHLPEFEACQ